MWSAWSTQLKVPGRAGAESHACQTCPCVVREWPASLQALASSQIRGVYRLCKNGACGHLLTWFHFFCLFCDIFGQSLTQASQCKKGMVDGANLAADATYESESTSIYTFDIEFALVLASAHNLTLVCVSRRSALHQGRWHVQHQVKNSSHPSVLQGCITRQRKLTIHSHTMSHLSPEECLCRAFSLL